MRDKSMQKPEQRKNGPIGDWIYIRYLGAMTEFEKKAAAHYANRCQVMFWVFPLTCAVAQLSPIKDGQTA
jgi:hypothetical protein